MGMCHPYILGQVSSFPPLFHRNFPFQVSYILDVFVSMGTNVLIAEQCTGPVDVFQQRKVVSG